MQRRDFAGILGGIVAGGVGVQALTGKSQAMAVQMTALDVADESVTTAQPVTGVSIRVNTAYSWTTTVTPTRVVLRLTATYAGESFQLGATEVPGQLTPEQSGEHEFQENLLDHPRINAPALTPQQTGETARLTFDVGVTMTVYGESGALGEKTITDTATIEITKQKASIETTLTADGSISVTTKTPR